MNRTSCIVSFGSNALILRDDAVITEITGDLQPFADLDALETGTVVAKPFATYEPDYWLLDGNFKFAPDSSARGGWVSLVMSAASGAFDFGVTKPWIQIDFDEVHSTDGLYFIFSNTGDYADGINIVFYDAALSVINSTFYNPTGETFSTNQSVANFKRIVIVIHSTNRASRYGRVMRLDLDALTRFEGSDIKAARVVQEINPLSVKLSIDTLELDLFSTDGDFSIVDPQGFYASLQYKEPLDVHEEVGEDVVYIGRFYLDSWESKSENEAHFEASDAIGLLDSGDYLPQIYPGTGEDGNQIGEVDPISTNGIWTVSAAYLIADIMLQAGREYELDASLSSAIIKGWLPVTTYRECLQQVAFRLGAYVTCARSNVIRILPIQLGSDLTFPYNHILTSAEKGITSPLTLKPLVTAVEIISHDYSSDGLALSEKISLTGPANGVIFIVKFDEPIRDVTSVTNAGTERYGSTWYELESFGGTITFTGRGYTDTKKIETISGSPPAGTPSNIIKIEDATLVSVSIVNTVAQRVYDYYAQRYLQKTKLLASLVAPGDSVLVDVQSSRQLAGIVERMEIDLAGGFVSDVEIVGVII